MNITDMLWNKNNSNAYFDSLYSHLSKKIDFLSFSVRVLSLESNNYSIRYDCNKNISSKRIDDLTLKHLSTSENKIGKEGNVFVYLVEKDLKLHDDKVFEVVITFRSRLYNDSSPISKLYLACDKKFKDDLIALINDNSMLVKLEVSLQLLKMNNDHYERIFYLVDIFSELLAVKDHMIPNHMLDVANLSMLLATKLQLNELETMVLYLSALIHDIGKVFVPDDLLIKSTKYTIDDYENMKIHPIKGYKIANAILMGVNYLSEVPHIVRGHHEWFDGTGYPDQLSGDKIPYFSRIIAIVDAVSIMLYKHKQKNHLSINSIINELKRQSGTQFDPELVDLVIDLLLENKKALGISTIAETHFIPLASISFMCGEEMKHYSYTGNMVIKNGISKFIVHSSEDIHLNFLPEDIFNVHVSFFSLNKYEQFTCDTLDIIGTQFIIQKMKPLVIDKFIMTRTDLEAQLHLSKLKLIKVKIIQMGEHGLIFTVDQNVELNISSIINAPMCIKVNLEIDSKLTELSIKGSIISAYDFGYLKCFSINYNAMSSFERDMLFKYIFTRRMDGNSAV